MPNEISLDFIPNCALKFILEVAIFVIFYLFAIIPYAILFGVNKRKGPGIKSDSVLLITTIIVLVFPVEYFFISREIGEKFAPVAPLQLVVCLIGIAIAKILNKFYEKSNNPIPRANSPRN